MAESTPSTLEILIDIRARIDELVKAQSGLKGVAEDARNANEAANRLGGLLRQGLGIGSGMELARRAVDLFREAFTRAVGMSSQLAAEIERAHGRLGLAGEAYQTLATAAREVETDFGEVTSSIAQYRAQLGEALLDPTKGTVLRAIAQDAQTLAGVPLERQLERIAVALGGVTDENVRARFMQELFGRGAAAMAPILERLRVEGYDKLRASAKETNTILGDGTAEALNKAQNRAEEAQKRLGVALAPLNLRLIETRTQLVNMLARNAGPITSGVEASFAAAFASALVSGVEKGAMSVERMGGLRAAFSKLGALMAGPFGVALITGIGTVIIRELERRALEANARESAFAEGAYRRPKEVQEALPSLTTEEQLRALYNRAVERNNAAIKERTALQRTPAQMMDDEKRAQIAALDMEIQRWQALIPLIKEKGRAAIEANRAERASFDQLKELQTDLLVIEMNHAKVQNSIQGTGQEKRTEELVFLRNKATLLQAIADLTKKLPVRPGEEEERRREVNKLEGEVAQINQQITDYATPLSDRERIGREFDTFQSGRNEQFGRRLSPGEGAEAGAMQWVMSVGTQGEQIAGALQSTLGTTVQNISDGIYGWITGAQSFGDTVRNLAGSVLRIALDTIVQMGVQWLVSAALGKASMLGLHIFGEGLRTQRVAATATEGAATTTALAPGAAAASISSFGMAAIIGIAALLAAMAAFGGFAKGGYTGDGAVDEVAGFAHRGEVVWSQQNVKDAGGVAAVEAMRLGNYDLETVPVPAPVRATTVAAPQPVGASMAAGAGAFAPQKRERLIAVVDRPTMQQIIREDPDAENVIADVMYRRRGDLFS